MAEDNKNRDKDDTPYEGLNPAFFNWEQKPQPEIKQQNPSNNQDESGNKRVTVIVEDGIEKTRIEKITLWSIRVNTVIAVVTIAYVIITYCTLSFMKQSAADNDIINKRLAKASEISANASQKSAEAADSSFGEVKKEFEMENMPFLQIEDARITAINSNLTVTFEYKITNIGRQPVKVCKECFTYKYISSNIYNDFLKTTYKSIPFKDCLDVSYYLIKEIKTTHYAVTSTPVEPEWVDMIKKGSLIVFMCGKIEYENCLTKKKRLYEFIIDLNQHNDTQPSNSTGYNFIYNENINSNEIN